MALEFNLKSTYPWYVVLLLAWYMRVKVDSQKIGFRALYRGMKIGEEIIRLRDYSGDEALVLTVPVYDVKLHYHPAIPVKNLMKGIGKE